MIKVFLEMDMPDNCHECLYIAPYDNLNANKYDLICTLCAPDNRIYNPLWTSDYTKIRHPCCPLIEM